MRKVFLAAWVLLLPSRVLAAQFVVAEVTYEHSATTTTDSHLRLPPSAETPKDWKAPIDYATAGKVYVRLEVFTKPSNENTRFQICFEATPSYACTSQSPAYTKPGVYTWDSLFPNFFQYKDVDWTKGIVKTALILKDNNNMKPSPEKVGEARAKLFMPTKLRVTVTVVQPGSVYVPPKPPMDVGVDAGADTAADAGGAAIAADAGVPSGPPGGGGLGGMAGVGGSSSPSGGNGGATASADSQEGGGGCSFAPRRSGSAALLPLLGIAMLAVIRRRSSSRASSRPPAR